MEAMTSLLTGKKVFVLGGSAGIGLATAKAAAAEGAEVTVVSGNSARIASALMELPEHCQGQVVDLRVESAVRKFFDHSGSFDHLIYTAGENLNLDFLSRTDLQEAQQFFNLRYWGALAAIKYAAPNINAGGSVSLISGTAFHRPGAGWAMAASICGAVEGLVRAMAVELAPVRVNCVVPGVVRTGLWDSMSEEDRQGMYDHYNNQLLMRRVGEAEDVALGFLYLMKQSFGTGQTLVIDGGTLLI